VAARGPLRAQAGRLAAERLRELEDRAALEAIELQHRAGIEVFTDGEMRRDTWMAGLLESTGGMVPVEARPEASQYVPIGDLALSPQCGFASTARGNRLTVDDERRKLELVSDTARKVWG
jgi:methionine synthase II (cobalamin-independent)